MGYWDELMWWTVGLGLGLMWMGGREVSHAKDGPYWVVLLLGCLGKMWGERVARM